MCYIVVVFLVVFFRYFSSCWSATNLEKFSPLRPHLVKFTTLKYLSYFTYPEALFMFNAGHQNITSSFVNVLNNKKENGRGNTEVQILFKFKSNCNHMDPKETCALTNCKNINCNKRHPKLCRYKNNCTRGKTCMYKHQNIIYCVN